jgi:hypothetical protein
MKRSMAFLQLLIPIDIEEKPTSCQAISREPTGGAKQKFGLSYAVSDALEADETYFRQSQKGSSKMTRPSRSRGGKARPKGSARVLVPVLIGRVRGTH